MVFGETHAVESQLMAAANQGFRLQVIIVGVFAVAVKIYEHCLRDRTPGSASAGERSN